MLKKVLLIGLIVLGIAFPGAIYGASYTPNLRLKKPTKTETGFLGAHNDNMQVIDTKVNEALSAVPISSLSYGTSVLGEWIADPSITTDQADATTAKSLAKIISDLSGASVDIRLPAGTYYIWRNYTIPATIKLKPDNGVVLTPWRSIRETTYKWTASGSGTSEYYLELAAGGNPGVYQPTSVYANSVALTAGTAGSLTAGKWAWADNDSLGYSTVYVRLSDSSDPDTKAAGYTEAWYTLTINGSLDAGAYQVFAGTGSVMFGAGAVGAVLVEWFGNHATDLGSALNKAIASIKAVGGEIRIPSGSLTLTTSVDGTGNSSHPIRIKGAGNRATVISAVLTGVAFDFTGSQFVELHDFQISGHVSTTPKCAFLFARNSTHGSAGQCKMFNVTTTGYWAEAALYNYAAEEFRAYNCQFTNTQEGMPAAVITADNKFYVPGDNYVATHSLSSAYATIDTGSQSTTEYLFVGCAFNQYGSAAANALVLKGVGSVTFLQLFSSMNCTGGAYVLFEMSDQGLSTVSFNGGMLDGLGNVEYGFRVHGTAYNPAYLTVEGFLFYGITATTGYGFAADPGSTVQGLIWRNNYSAVQILLYSATHCNLLLCPSEQFIGQYAIENSTVAVKSTLLSLLRPDFCESTRFIFTDKGSVYQVPLVSAHDYASGTTDWTVAMYEISSGRISATGASGAVNAILPAEFHGFIHVKNSAGYNLTVKYTSSTGIAVATSKQAILYADGSEVIRVLADY